MFVQFHAEVKLLLFFKDHLLMNCNIKKGWEDGLGVRWGEVHWVGVYAGDGGGSKFGSGRRNPDWISQLDITNVGSHTSGEILHQCQNGIGLVPKPLASAVSPL